MNSDLDSSATNLPGADTILEQAAAQPPPPGAEGGSGLEALGDIAGAVVDEVSGEGVGGLLEGLFSIFD